MLDEPTAALGVAQTAQVLDLIKRLRERGLGVVVISHNLADVFEVADRIVVLRLGRNGGEFAGRRRDQPQAVVAAITGASGNGQVAPRPTPSASHERRTAGRRRAQSARARTRRGAVLVEGELGSLRVMLGLAIIWTIFAIANDRFLTAVNLTNLSLQIAAVGTISIGVVLVLLLGEIDLSVGVVSGLAAAVHGGAQRQARLERLPRDRRRRSRSAPRSALFQGTVVTRFGDPVVRRHARRPARLAGRAAGGARRHRHGQHHRPRHHEPRRRRSSPTAIGWVLAGACIAVAACSSQLGARRAARAAPGSSRRRSSARSRAHRRGRAVAIARRRSRSSTATAACRSRS